MDKFPEAFNRYEERVDLDDLQSASELISSFSNWQSYNPTSKQLDALKIESKKRRLGFDWSIPKWVKKKDYWRFPHEAIVTQNWRTTAQSGKQRGFRNKQILVVNEGIKKGYSANKIQRELKNKGIGIRRKVLLRQIREIKMKSPKVNPEKYIPRKYRRRKK
jgi:hypothetical protein